MLQAYLETHLEQNPVNADVDSQLLVIRINDWLDQWESYSSKVKRSNVEPEDAFSGDDYVPSRDFKRLSKVAKRVFDVVKDGQWRGYDEIGQLAGLRPAYVSAHLRNFRKVPFGAHTLNKRHVKNGYYQFQLLVNPDFIALFPDHMI